MGEGVKRWVKGGVNYTGAVHTSFWQHAPAAATPPPLPPSPPPLTPLPPPPPPFPPPPPPPVAILPVRTQRIPSWPVVGGCLSFLTGPRQIAQ